MPARSPTNSSPVTITEVHQASRGIYGALRVHAELRLGMACRRKRLARLMRSVNRPGFSGGGVRLTGVTSDING